MNVSLPKITTQKITVTDNGGILQSSTPYTLKNQINEIQSLENIPGVVDVNKISGATLLYNSVSGNFEIRPLQASDITGNIDLGTF